MKISHSQANLNARSRRCESQEDLLYKDDSQFKLYVQLKHEDKSDYKKLVLSASTLFNVVQLKRQIEKEFRNEFPRDPVYYIKNLCLTSGYVLPNSSKIGEVLKYGESLIAYPEKEKLYQHNCDQFCTCQFKTPATDLINQLQDQQKSLASKLTEASIQRFDDKIELIKNTASMGMAKDVRVIQNLALTLNKLITGPLVIEFDKEDNKNTLNLLVLVLQYWCTDLIDKDQLILINTMQLLECLAKSWTFTSAFKQQREAMEKLEKMAQDPQMAPSDRNQIFRVVSTISSTININTIPEYNKAHFYNWKAIDNICQPDGIIISKSNLYEPPMNHKQFERGIKSNFAQTPNVAISRSKKYRDPNKQLRFEGLDNDFRKLYSSEQPINNRTLRASQSTAVLPSISNNQRSTQLQHSGTLQFTTINQPPPHNHDPCYFQEQQLAQKYSQGGFSAKRDNLKFDKTGSYLVNPYKVTFFKDKYPSLEKLPPIQMVYSGDLLKDYCTMLNPDINQRDIVVFALHSIDNMGIQAIKDIMNDKYLFLLSFLLFEYHNFPAEISQSQFRVSERLVEHLSKQRAIDLVENNGINRLLKNFKFQNSNMKKLITDLIYKLLSYTKDYIDIPLLVNLTLFPNQDIQNAGIKTICEISDPADLEGNMKKQSQDRIDVTFHIHIPYLIQICQRKNSPQVFRNYSLQTLANLTNREYLKSYITFNKGLEVFIDYIKDTNNLNGMRIATKALTQMAKGDTEMKVKLMQTLRREIKDTWDGVQDPVVSAYLKKMLKEGVNFDT